MRKFSMLVATFLSAMGYTQTQPDSLLHERNLEEIVVTSTRFNSDNMLNQDAYSIEKLQASNIGVNLPYLLTQTPSLVVTSDDGLGVGYTYFRVRGTDHTRINMTINNIPLNDSESQTVFWVNMTDMAASLGSVMVQRGVGTSTNGQASFGASVNMQTEKASASPSAEITFNGGMYNTFRESAKISTGIMNSGFAFDARFSKVNSDGYLERAFSDLYSYAASAAWYGTHTLLKFLAFGGSERTYMAWDGIDAETLAKNPRHNPAGAYIDDNGKEAFYPNQTDNFAQQHYQLHWSQSFAHSVSMNVGLHYTHGSGYYEQYKVNAKLVDYGLKTFADSLGNQISRTDLVRQKQLNNDFYGGIFSLNYAQKHLKATVGGALNHYIGNHFGNVLWLRKAYPYSHLPNDEYYRNQGLKLDVNAYTKVDWEFFAGWKIFGDLQFRHVDYRINGVNDEDLSELALHEKFNFFNPKAGISYTRKNHYAYASFAMTNREPNRKNYTEAGPNEVPVHETLYDYELGYNFSNNRLNVGLNCYFMNYDNQLVLTGKYSDTGAYLTKNVKDSYRAGVEMIVGVKITDWLRWNGNLTLSRNKILHYTDWVDDWQADWDDPQIVANSGQVQVDYSNVDISFSPAITAGSVFEINKAGFQATLQTNYVGKQYLDNTQNEQACLPNYCISNLRLAYTFSLCKMLKNITLNVQINNLFNTHYASNGGAYSYFEGTNENGLYLPENKKYTTWFYAQAGFNIHAGFCAQF